jgi:hypothetical protein
MSKFNDFKKIFKERYNYLPISSFNDFKIVIVSVFENSNEGWGNHSFSGLGMNKNGELYWCYSSGCSCSGSCEAEETTIKVLKAENPNEFEEFMKRIEEDNFEDILKNIDNYSFSDYE